VTRPDRLGPRGTPVEHRIAGRFLVAAFVLSLPLACGGESISMGWDDPERKVESFSCGPMSCGNPPMPNPMCPNGRWGTYECLENPMVPSTCTFQATCERLTPCAPADCSEPTSGQAMCNGGFRDWVCDADGQAACGWVLPADCLGAP
jgi:hypothetical protein